MGKFYRYISILAITAGIFIAVYYFVRVYFFLSSGNSWLDNVFALLLLLGETYMIIHAFGFIVNIFRLRRKKYYKLVKLDQKHPPSVAVVVAAYHEPKEILEQTFVTLRNLDYANKKMYLLDGSTDDKILKTDRELAKKHGIIFFHSGEKHGTKAGIINKFLAEMDEKYLAVFDADQNPMPDFLEKVVAIAEGSGKIAFVQTPQFYSNIQVSPIANGSGMQQAVFYESICEAKGSVNAMFCCGTNVLFRRSALLEVGGFNEASITEDFATSVKLHLAGYRSVYYNHVRVFGMAPESLPAYFRQQARWAAGTVGVFRELLLRALKTPGRLSAAQWWEYLLSSTYYFIGAAFFLLMMSPIMYLLFAVPSYFLNSNVYIATFIPYYLMTLAVFYATMKKRNYSIYEVYNGIILGSLSFPILIVAAIRGLTGHRMKFLVTPKGQTGKVSLWGLGPWIFMIALNGVAIGVGVTRFSQYPYAIGVNIFWCLYHMFVLAQIFRFNRAPDLAANSNYLA